MPGLALAALAAAVYSPSLGGGFIWDDHAYLVENPLLADGAGLARLWFSLDQPDYWPLSGSVLWLLRQIAGTMPWPYHLAQVLLHALAAVLAWWTLREVRWRGAWLAAALWAVHPLSVQVVTWPFQLKTTLCACFFFASCGTFARGLRLQCGRLLAVSLLLFALAVLSKTQAVMLPLVLLGLTWWHGGSSHSRRNLAVTLPFFAVAIGAGVMTIVMQPAGETFDATLGMGLPGRVAAAGHALVFYLRAALWPTQLAAVYPRWTFDPQTWISLWPLLLVAGLLLVLGVAARRRSAVAPVLAGVLFFLVNLAPVLGLLDFQYLTLAPVADHFAYLALLGLTAAVAHGLAAGGDVAHPMAPRVLGAALVAACITLTLPRLGVYRSDESLWQHNIEAQPTVWVGYTNLGLVRMQQERFAEAEALHARAAELRPDRPDVWLDLGDARMEQGRFAQARQAYEQAVSSMPDWALAHLRLGKASEAMGDDASAQAAFREALRLDPESNVAEQHLSELLRR